MSDGFQGDTFSFKVKLLNIIVLILKAKILYQPSLLKVLSITDPQCRI